MSSAVGIGIAGGLIILGVLAIIVAGLKSLKDGRQDLKKIIMFLIPFVVFGVSFGITNDFADAGIATMLFMMATMVLTILGSGLKSTFNL